MRRSPRTRPALSWTGTDVWAVHSAPTQARQLITSGSVTFSRPLSWSAPPVSNSLSPHPTLPSSFLLSLWVCLFSCFYISPSLCLGFCPLAQGKCPPFNQGCTALHGWSQPDRHQCPALAEPWSQGTSLSPVLVPACHPPLSVCPALIAAVSFPSFLQNCGPVVLPAGPFPTLDLCQPLPLWVSVLSSPVWLLTIVASLQAPGVTSPSGLRPGRGRQGQRWGS